MGNIAAERLGTGNHVRIYASGTDAKKLLGYGKAGPVSHGTGAGLQQSTGANEQYGIGNERPLEIVDGRYGFGVRLDMLFLRPQVSEAADLVNSGAIDIEFIDRFNGKRIAIAIECHLADGSTQIPANQPITKGLSFRCMDIR